MTEYELNTKQKEMIFRFHIKDVTMTEVANELNVSPNEAYKIYKNNIVGVIKEFKDTKYYQLHFGEGDKKVAEPKTKAEPKPKPEPKSEPEPEPVPEPEPPEAELSEPEVSIKKDVVASLMGDDLPVIIEDGEYSKEVSLFLTGGDEDAIATVTKGEELPPIGIGKKAVLETVEESYILVQPVFNEEKNAVGITVETVDAKPQE